MDLRNLRYGFAVTRAVRLLALLLCSTPAAGGVIHVPAEQPTVQAGLDAAFAGDTVEVAAGVYFEKVVFPRSGTLGMPIVLRGLVGAVLDGTGVSGQNMVLIDSASHVAILGFEIRNNLGVSDGSGIRVLGQGSDVELRGNVIHDIRGSHAMGITVYGTEPVAISSLVIADNQIYDCDPAQSEALTLNGNINGFTISGNLVRDVNNIGIDMIGGELDIQPNPALVARNGVVRGNTVIHANSNYEGGYAGGIYVDGGRDIVIENNWVSYSDLGIEIGAENSGITTRNVTVRNNVIFRNERAGLVFGGFEAAAGRVEDSAFTGNTFFENNTVGETGQGTYFPGGGIAEIWLQWATDNGVENNLVYAGPENIFVGSFDGGSSIGNAFDFNLYFSPDPANGEFSLNDQYYTGLGAWQAGAGQDASSLVADPLMIDPANEDFHLAANSPAVDRGDPEFVPAQGELDLDAQARLTGDVVEIGADELGGDEIFADGFESGDSSAWSNAVP